MSPDVAYIYVGKGSLVEDHWLGSVVILQRFSHQANLRARSPCLSRASLCMAWVLQWRHRKLEVGISPRMSPEAFLIQLLVCIPFQAPP